MRVSIGLLILLAVSAGAHGQAAAPARFEAASIKLNANLDAPRRLAVDPRRFTATAIPLVDLIRYAYGVESRASRSQVSGGPAWLATARFDIVATSTGQPTPAMLKSLLDERFAVVAHVERRDAPVDVMRLD